MIKSLPHKHENLSSIPRTHVLKKKKEGDMIVIPVLGNQRQADPGDLVVSLLSKPKARERP